MSFLKLVFCTTIFLFVRVNLQIYFVSFREFLENNLHEICGQTVRTCHANIHFKVKKIKSDLYQVLVQLLLDIELVV